MEASKLMNFLSSKVRCHRAAIVAFAVTLGAAGPLFGQNEGSAGGGSAKAGSSARRVMVAAPLEGEIRLDGRLDEAAWAAATPAGDFTQSWPRQGEPATFPSEVRVLVGNDALYVGIRMYDPHPDSIAAPLARRDASGIYSDWVHLMIDSRMDRRTAFRFTVNPRGVMRDAYHFDDGNEDAAWDAVWDVATSIDSEGWTAEYRIPLSQLRFASGEGGDGAWGIGVMRDVARHDERSTWSPWSRDYPGFVSAFGTLDGVAELAAPRRLEVMPYLSSRLTREPGDVANPFYKENATGGEVGVDLKLGLPHGLTLDATINPDFGQVEVDPAQVNLSTFETFFSERRPFFTEGRDVFSFGAVRSYTNYESQEYFYSRRIGRAPRLQNLGGGVAYADVPAQTRILGATKLSGKTPGGWSVGVLNAVTAEEHARYVDTEGERGTRTVEPLTNYSIARVRRDLRGGQTVVGALGTAAFRDLSDPTLSSLMHRRAFLGGIDFDHRWSDRVWSLSGFIAASHVSGEESALQGTQRTSARYFHRPDAGYLEYDPSRTSLQGHMASLALARGGADGWDISLAYKEVSPGFEINDVGFQGRTDYRAVTTFLGRPINRPWGIFRNTNIYAFSYHVWNFGGDPILNGFAASARGTFQNLWSSSVQMHYRPSVSDDRLTRGGPIATKPEQWTLNFHVATDPRKNFSSVFEVAASGEPSGGGQHSRILLLVRPAPQLRAPLAGGSIVYAAAQYSAVRDYRDG